MPGNVSFVVRHCMHGPSDEPRAVAVLEQPRDLTVGHHPARRDSEDELIDSLEYQFETGRSLSAAAATRFFVGSRNRPLPSSLPFQMDYPVDQTYPTQLHNIVKHTGRRSFNTETHRARKLICTLSISQRTLAHSLFFIRVCSRHPNRLQIPQFAYTKDRH